MFPGALMLDAREEEAVLEVLRSRNLFRYYGPSEPAPRQVEGFERDLASFLGVRHVVAVNSGTSALMTGLAALGVGPGDEVIVPAYTWIATANAIVLHGAAPVLCEVDDSLTLDPEDLQQRITSRTKAVIPVHMQGVPADMDAITTVAQRHGLLVLEDCAQAMGARLGDRAVGAWGDVGCFSLQINKVLTSGEGGAVATSDPDLWTRARIWHDGAGIWNDARVAGFPGENYRMPEVCGAIARVQLTKAATILERMRWVKERVLEGIADLRLALRRLPPGTAEAAVSLVLFARDSRQAEGWAAALNAENVPAAHLYHPERRDYHVAWHWRPLLDGGAASPGRPPYGSPDPAPRIRPETCPQSLDLLGRAVSVAMHPLYDDADVAGIVEGIRKVVIHLG